MPIVWPDHPYEDDDPPEHWSRCPDCHGYYDPDEGGCRACWLEIRREYKAAGESWPFGPAPRKKVAK